MESGIPGQSTPTLTLQLLLIKNSKASPSSLPFEQHILSSYYFIKICLEVTLSRWRFPSYRNQSIDLICKSVDWFLYDRNHRYERLKLFGSNCGLVKKTGLNFFFAAFCKSIAKCLDKNFQVKLLKE